MSRFSYYSNFNVTTFSIARAEHAKKIYSVTPREEEFAV